MSGTEQDDPLPEATLAAEYVLGTLDPVEHAAAAHRAATDPGFAAEIAFWEQRLAPLGSLVPPVPPPANLWARIEDSTHRAEAAAPPQAGFTAPPPPPANSNWLWQISTAAGFALAAGFAAYILLRPLAPPPGAPAPGVLRNIAAGLRPPPPAPNPALAVLTPYGTETQVLIAYRRPDGAITIRPNAAVRIPEGKDLELWQLPKGATKPASLGVVPAGGKDLPPGIAPGTMLLVSLEPKGGSPTGQPTGPVLFGGQLTQLN